MTAQAVRLCRTGTSSALAGRGGTNWSQDQSLQPAESWVYELAPGTSSALAGREATNWSQDRSLQPAESWVYALAPGQAVP